MQPLKKSRLKAGDIFAISINNGYIFGRLIKTDLSFEDSPFGGSNLIYIYKYFSSVEIVDISLLNPKNLLVAPMFISNLLWSKGYAKKIKNDELSANVLLKQHCFYSNVSKKFYDENGRELLEKTEPCGEWIYIVGLRHIDNIISDAIGLKRSALQEEDLFYYSGSGEKIWYKKSISELKKYSNYEETIKKYPEVIQDQITIKNRI